MEKPPTVHFRGKPTRFVARCMIIPALVLLSWASARAQLQAAFTMDHAMGCGSVAVQFTDVSTGNPSAWHWDFGGGKTSELQNPASTFTTPGTHTVTLTVSNGVTTSSVSHQVNVHDNPVAKFSADTTSGCYPLGVHFTDESTAGDGGFDSWTWDFGDGSPFSHEQNPMHVYNSAGTFTPILTVTNKAGCDASYTGNKIVTNEGVTVDFSADKTFSCAAPLTVTFTATASGTDPVSYTWDFGDGTAHATGASATHTYTTDGNFSVSVTAAVGGGGCQSVVTKNDYILVGKYTSEFTVPQGCAGVPLSFKNTSLPKPVSSSWDFGDGKTATGIDATHQYAASGTYSVTLTNDFGGCTSQVSHTITTYPSPVADFSTAQTAFCDTPANATFQNLSQQASSWKWRFGDGDSSTLQQGAHTYLAGGTYNVTLEAVSDKGCVDSVTRKDLIKVDAPDIRFKASDGFGCVPLTTTFSIPAASQADIASYAWDFGDKSPVSTQASPTHTFNTESSFSVTLQVVTKSGCKLSFTRANYINTGTKPTAKFTATPRDACRETPVKFTNQSSPPGDIWLWVFPQDNATDTAQNPSHQFTTLGSQDVTLVVTNHGCSDTLTKRGYITVNPPQAKITRPATLPDCSHPYTYTFHADQSLGTGNTYSWDFGDGPGSTGSGETVTYTFKSAGAKKVVLTATNGSCSSQDTYWIQVSDEDPVMNASASSACHGDSVTLSLSNVKIPDFYSKLTWSDGAGHTLTNGQSGGKIPVAKFAYGANGSYTPSVKITFANGCTKDFTGPTIQVHGPQAAFTTSTNEVCQGNVVTFTDQSAPNPAGAAITRWVWSYGDQQADTTTTGSSVHTYVDNGTFQSQLTVTDANGCSDRTTSTIANQLIVNPSKANFSTPDTLVCPGSGVAWTNNSAGTGASYLWVFGDGDSSRAPTPPDHYYALDSVYTVKLTVTTTKGCTDSLTRTDYITVAHPEALMQDSSPVKICRIYIDTAVNLSTHYRSIFWDFGDGFTSTRDTAYHIYNVPGTYRQVLRVQGYSPGCMDSVVRQIIIAGPVGTPVISDTDGCAPFHAVFSANNVKRAVQYQWFFGNGAAASPSGSADADYTYTTAGLFHPTLKLTDDTGCYVIVPFNDSLTVVVDSVGSQPVFSWPEQCDSNKVTFSTEGSVFSEKYLGATPTYQWDFGDPSSSNDVSPDSTATYRYPAAGTYQADLAITTRFGCSVNLPLAVVIPDSIPLTATASADPTEICAGNTIQLHAGSNLAETYLWSPATGLDNPSSPDPVATPPASTTYTVTTTSKGSCQTAQAQVSVVVHDNPVIDAGDDLTVPTGSVITLAPTGSQDIISWSWSPAEYLSCTSCQSPTVTPRSNMLYTVQVANSFGCTSSDSLKLNLVCDEGKVFIPNTFTPNGDGQNDLFYPRGRGVKSVLYFRIYNRYGQLVFESTRFQLNDSSSGWNGTMQGKKLDPGVFIYTTEMVCDNDKIFKLSGNITLLR